MLAGSLAWSFPHLLACGEAAPAVSRNRPFHAGAPLAHAGAAALGPPRGRVGGYGPPPWGLVESGRR
jgi:hypothetical protein